MITRGLPIGVVALALAISCGSTESDEPREAPLHCGTGPTSAPGSWTALRQPEEVLTLGTIPGVVFSDGQRLWTTNGSWLGTLEPSATEWAVTETVPTPGAMDLLNYWTVAGERHLFGAGSVDQTSTTLEVLDLGRETWSSYAAYNPATNETPRPSGLGGADRVLGAALWSVSVLARQGDGGEQVTASYVVFDAVSESWRTGVDEALGEPYAVPSQPVNNFTSFAWTGSTLFLWGPLRDGTTLFMRSFDAKTETWATLPTEGGPGPRVAAGMLADGHGHLFIHGGQGTSDERPLLRELWRFDLDDETWTKLDVPAWVDPALGAVIDGKLYFIGGCTTGAVYDPSVDSWGQLPALAALDGASGTQLRVAGNRLAISGIFYHPHTHVQDVFLFDPSGGTSANPGIAGSDSAP